MANTQLEIHEPTPFDPDPTFLVIRNRRHWVDKVLRANAPDELGTFLEGVDSIEHRILGEEDAHVITETDQNYRVTGEISIAHDGMGRRICSMFSFRAYGNRPYITFFYSSPRVISH
ncbi:hypothetical protein HYT52_00855 [Candidatus Woesearchaeota archaeon]|nr:hypothetical protein [Candidatus Woesearchaeota archaeon]